MNTLRMGLDVAVDTLRDVAAKYEDSGPSTSGYGVGPAKLESGSYSSGKMQAHGTATPEALGARLGRVGAVRAAASLLVDLLRGWVAACEPLPRPDWPSPLRTLATRAPHLRPVSDPRHQGFGRDGGRHQMDAPSDSAAHRERDVERTATGAPKVESGFYSSGKMRGFGPGDRDREAPSHTVAASAT